MNSLVNTILFKADIVEYIGKIIPLKRMGNDWRGPCPIHRGDNSTSLIVYSSTKTYYCFSCGSYGNIIDFVKEYYRVDYDEAVEMLAEEFNIPIDRYEDYQKHKQISEDLDREVRGYARNVDQVSEYLIKKRGLTEETIKNFGLGYGKNSIVIPLKGVNDKVIGIARRQLEAEPKYINSKNSDIYDKSSFLFNMGRARKFIRNNLYLVEGYFDAMIGDQQGLPFVAYCSMEISRGQIDFLQKTFSMNPYMTFYLIPDNDGKAFKRLSQVREKFKHYAPLLNVHVLVLPDGVKDFADYRGNIGDLEDLPLDVFVLQEELINIPYKETQWRFVEDYIKTIKNEGIKDEIAKFVSSHFSREISEVRKMFQVACSDNTETILQDFKTIDIALQDYKELLSRGTISTGFATIDESINKVRKSEIMFLAAYAGVLKTFLAVKMALHMAFKQNKNVIFFSMEMSAGALAERMVANILGISTREVERRVIEGDEIINKIKGAIDEKIYIVDKNSLGLKEIRNYIEIAATRKFDAPVDCVFIDYLQYMKGTSSYEDISETAKGFKPIAKEMNLSFIILSQLNRGGSQWQRPDIGQLRGSGDIEATGDFVLGIWRPEFNPTITLEQRIELKNQIQLAILKARRGYVGPGEFSFRFLPEKTDIIEE